MGEERKPISVKEYRKKHTKLIEGTAGDIYKIRKLPPLAISQVIELTDIPGLKPEEEMTEEQKGAMTKIILAKLSEFMTIVLPAVIVEPPVSLEGDENTLGLNELNPDDLEILFETALDFSGLSDKATEERELFRKEQVGESDRSAKPAPKKTK